MPDSRLRAELAEMPAVVRDLRVYLDGSVALLHAAADAMGSAAADMGAAADASSLRDLSVRLAAMSEHVALQAMLVRQIAGQLEGLAWARESLEFAEA